jgi:hypothetical protein
MTYALRHPRRFVRCIALAALLCVTVLGTGGVVRADMPSLDEGGAFDVRSAYLEPADQVYHLNATLDLALAKSAEQALKDGVPVLIQLDVQVVRQRRVFSDERIASVTQRWRLQYHALSERYLVINLNTNQQASYASLPAAITALSDVHMLPILDESRIQKGSRYDAAAKVTVLVEGGLPNALRAMMFWIDWKHVTEWYTWTVAL